MSKEKQKIAVSIWQKQLHELREAKRHVLKEFMELDEAEQILVKQIAMEGKEGTDKYRQAQLCASTELLKTINDRKKFERHRIMMQASSTK